MSYNVCMNMFAKNKAKSVKEYIENVPEERKNTIMFLHKFIQDAAPKLKPHFAYNMLGYGTFKYMDSKKTPKEWPVVALANQKNYISLYICALDGGEYIAEKHKDKLGKVSVGRSCIRFKKIEDLNLKELKKILKKGEKSPGLVGATLMKD